MKILLTGADGFTGRFFKAKAIEAGHEVCVIKSDLTDKNNLVAEVSSLMPADALVHMAAVSFVGHADDTDFYRVNVIGTMNLLDAVVNAATDPFEAILIASSANIYGNCEESPINEYQSPAPVNHYAMSKLAMEYMAKTYLDKLPIIIARPFNYTGPGQGQQFLIPKLVKHFISKSSSVELGNLHVEREFNDVRMVCDAYLKLLFKGVPGEAYNICSGRPYSLSNVIDLFEQIQSHTMEIRVNAAYVRANEVHSLCGNPNKLNKCVGPLEKYELKETLAWMLESSTRN
jgi:GDP-6-deoxy-D-talose 4-dehydrogenase